MTVSDWHPSEDDLTLALTGDGEADTDRVLVNHVRHCATCRATQDDLAAVLALVASAPEADPGDDFEDRMWARIQPALSSQPARSWHARQLVPMLAWAAAVGGVVVGGYFASARVPVRTPVMETAAVASDTDTDDAQERVLLAAVDAHLTQTEMLFVELLNTASMSQDELAFARATAGDLVSSGRLYRETARDSGDAPVALMLDDLETVLVEVARSSDRAGTRDLALLRDRIEGEDLLFKVRAVTHDIRVRQGRPAEEEEGAL